MPLACVEQFSIPRVSIDNVIPAGNKEGIEAEYTLWYYTGCHATKLAL